MQEAITIITKFLDQYPQIYKFAIVDHNHFYIYLTDYKVNKKEFYNLQELEDWCQNNLEEYD